MVGQVPTRARSPFDALATLARSGQALAPRLRRPRLKRLCHNLSFAPSGLAHFPLLSHGSRRGLHSYAASRLPADCTLHFTVGDRVVTQPLKPGVYLKARGVGMTPIKVQHEKRRGFCRTPLPHSDFSPLIYPC